MIDVRFVALVLSGSNNKNTYNNNNSLKRVVEATTMALVDILIRFGLTMVALMLYITGFGSAVWISTDVDFEDRGKISWGLWVVCDNSTINRRRCPHMSPGDSDGT